MLKVARTRKPFLIENLPVPKEAAEPRHPSMGFPPEFFFEKTEGAEAVPSVTLKKPEATVEAAAA